MTRTQSQAFRAALEHTLKEFEGGYANNPNDHGGETFRGISRVAWPNWPGWRLIDRAKAEGFTWAAEINSRFAGHTLMEEMVADLYHQNFWCPLAGLAGRGLDRLQVKLFDTGVNVGLGRAVKFLQRIIRDVKPELGLLVDGVLGPRTRAALDGMDEGALLTSLCREQEEHYRGIVKRDPSQAQFLDGWLRRAAWVPK
jgi:lysozyme family protein